MIKEQAYIETDIIWQAQNGSQAAYGELYQRHCRAIHQYIDKRVNSRCDAEDLTQTVFLKAWQALRDYQPTATPFRAWLYRIAHNAVVDHYRSQREVFVWDELTLAMDPQHAPEMVVLEREHQETVEHAITLLRPAYQEILVQRFLRNMDYTEMAAELGHQVNNLRVLQHRALEALRRVLTHEAALGVAIALTIMLLSRYMVVEAAQALPGDGLYPLRTVAEETRLFLADDATALLLHTDFAAQRIAELRLLAEQGRAQDMATTANNFAWQIKAASAQLNAAQAQSNARQVLTDQFKQVLQQQSAELAQLAATVPPALRPAIQPALMTLAAVQTALPDPAKQHSSSASKPTNTATSIATSPTTDTAHATPTQTPAAPAGQKPRQAEPDVLPTPAEHEAVRPAQRTPSAPVTPTVGPTAARGLHHQTTQAARVSSVHQTPTDHANPWPTHVQAANVIVTPTRALPAVATPADPPKKVKLASPEEQPGAAAQQPSAAPAPLSEHHPAPTDVATANSSDHTQDAKAVTAAQDNTAAPPEHKPASEHKQDNSVTPHADHAPNPSDPHKDHGPKL